MQDHSLPTPRLPFKESVTEFYVHSTFRHRGKQVLPYGLEWGTDGDSYLTFVPAGLADPGGNFQLADLETESFRRGIVHAYNRWAFAKDVDFKSMQEIDQLTVHNDGRHIHVDWKPPTFAPFQLTMHHNMEEVLRKDPAANQVDNPVDVWVNGEFAGKLNGEMSLYPILMRLKAHTGPGTQLSYKRSDRWIRIERYFTGMLRKHQVFEHIMDNLIALEDPQILGPTTFIGSATLPDWIMGGQLTSRLHVEEILESGNWKFVRPLYHDNLATADRHFRLKKGRDDDKIKLVQKEVRRLRFLASMKHPFTVSTNKQPKPALMSEQPVATFEFTGTWTPDDTRPATDDRSISSSIIFLKDRDSDSPSSRSDSSEQSTI